MDKKIISADDTTKKLLKKFPFISLNFSRAVLRYCIPVAKKKPISFYEEDVNKILKIRVSRRKVEDYAVNALIKGILEIYKS